MCNRMAFKRRKPRKEFCWLTFNESVTKGAGVLILKFVSRKMRQCGTNWENQNVIQPSVNMKMNLYFPRKTRWLLGIRSGLFLGITQCWIIAACALKMVPRGCPETSVRNYHFTMREVQKDRKSHLHRGGNLKLFAIQTILY